MKAATARYAVGVIGNIISFGLFLSPLPTFNKIIKNKTVEEFQPYPYIATVLNCMMWVFYGMPFVHPDSILVITINGIGLIVELTYLAIFFTYSTKKGRKLVILYVAGEVIFLAVVVALTLLLSHGHTKRTMVVGIICDIFNIIMYCAPLTIMVKVIKTKSVEYMPFWLSFANFWNGVIWTSYSLIHIFDPYILVSNSLGTISGICQLSLYAYYYKAAAKNKEIAIMQAVTQPAFTV